MLSASAVIGPLPASTINLDLILFALFLLITFSIAAGINMSHFLLRNLLRVVVNPS